MHFLWLRSPLCCSVFSWDSTMPVRTQSRNSGIPSSSNPKHWAMACPGCGMVDEQFMLGTYQHDCAARTIAVLDMWLCLFICGLCDVYSEKKCILCASQQEDQRLRGSTVQHTYSRQKQRCTRAASRVNTGNSTTRSKIQWTCDSTLPHPVHIFHN